jgi:cellulose synthase/poly-beta-1,6-N-acetylglucosamine synthase-like glycosyltransferase
MKVRRPTIKLFYLAFVIPFILAYLSWQLFPLFVLRLVTVTLNYEASFKTSNWVWYWTVRFFYTWYTFLAIGVAGMWVVAAAFVRAQHQKTKSLFYPMVSFVVPAYDEERNIERCIKSIFSCSERYNGTCQIIVVDDGSKDYTYERAWAAIGSNRKRYPQVRGKVVRHSVNLGKIEAIKTGVNSALGEFVAVVDADSFWMPNTLADLVDRMLSNGRTAVTGYVHPSDGDSELNPYVVLQQLEYSQGLGITRQAQSLGDNVPVISGAVGLYDARTLRTILLDKRIHSVTEDLEITLEIHKRGNKVGYVDVAAGSTIAPLSFRDLWNQRIRWFTGWLHNTLKIHRDLLFKKSWLTLFLWYCQIFEYGGAFIDFAALIAAPFLFWFSSDRIFFVASLLVFIPYCLLIVTVNQTIALKYAYNKHNYRSLLFYTPFYPILWLINILARLISSLKFLSGDKGNWSTK